MTFQVSLTEGTGGKASSSVAILLLLDFDLPRRPQTLDFVFSFLSVFFGGSTTITRASGASGNGANVLDALSVTLITEAALECLRSFNVVCKVADTRRCWVACIVGLKAGLFEPDQYRFQFQSFVEKLTHHEHL